ncbi:hypothetical protein IE53DRAFT_389365 [Violaceomyces palustris]|uniref:Uncharacterized protein n=1 Tax=Violaceomyces palustris TaxID=1673888 RepID=A0ACD0NRI8_9BASI|nr:hypothetical protein IE53DRAFT_389365 [Violaceomyces palustris]
MVKPSKGSERQHAPAVKDPRFARLHTDPRFLRPRREDTKVVIDDRFKSIFQAQDRQDGNKRDAGRSRAKVDKYGRKVSSHEKSDEMKRFYRLDQEEEEEEDSRVAPPSSDEDEHEDQTQGRRPVDYARGEGELESSSEEESSEDEEDSDEEDEDDDDDDDEVVIGPSSVIQREKMKKKKKEQEEEDDEDEDDGYGDDIGEIDLDEELDESAYAILDAQAERAIQQGGIEDGRRGAGSEDEDDDDEEIDIEAIHAARSKGKGKAKAANERPKKKNTIPRGDDTCRLAVVNMDWDHVRARDLYKVFSSLVSPTASKLPSDVAKAASAGQQQKGRSGPASNQVRGTLLHVKVYPSDFGKERMAREDVEGPPRELFKKSGGSGIKKSRSRKSKKSTKDASEDSSSSSEEEINEKTIVQVDDGGEFDEEALRKYQLERLRYYYAVATFDSPQTARHVYNEIDGTEMERTANIFDLRFVPDGMDFPDGEGGRPVEYRDEAHEDAGNYKGVDFKTDALRHSKVKLTWDQDDPERTKLTRLVGRGGLTKEQLRDDDFKAYLGSDSESEAEKTSASAARDRLRALLDLDGEGKVRGGSNVFSDSDDDRDGDEGVGDMQITFMPGLSEAAARRANGERKKKEGEDETTLEKYMRKQREKRERRKSERKEGGEGEDKEEKESDGGDEDEDVGEAISSGDGATAALGFDDPFFQNDDEMDFEAALAAEHGEGPTRSKAGKKGKKGKEDGASKKNKNREEEEEDGEGARARAELELMLDADSDEEGGSRHFDMKDIIRAESGKEALKEKKKARMLKRLSKKKRKEQEEFEARKGKPQTQDNFKIDTKDPRFEAMMEDHRFALDPSHPGFVKTKATEALLQERRKRQDSKRKGSEAKLPPVERQSVSNGQGGQGERGSGSEDLASLVQSLKKRSMENQGKRVGGNRAGKDGSSKKQRV